MYQLLGSRGGGRQQGPAAMTNKKQGNFDQIGAEKGVRLSNGKKFKKIFRLFPEGGASEKFKKSAQPFVRHISTHACKQKCYPSRVPVPF